MSVAREEFAAALREALLKTLEAGYDAHERGIDRTVMLVIYADVSERLVQTIVRKVVP